jgi:hypothetical protein
VSLSNENRARHRVRNGVPVLTRTPGVEDCRMRRLVASFRGVVNPVLLSDWALSPLLVVALDDLRSPQIGRVRIATGFA